MIRAKCSKCDKPADYWVYTEYLCKEHADEKQGIIGEWRNIP